MVGCAQNSGMAPTTGSSTMAQAQSTGNGAGWIHAGNIVYHVPHYMATRSAAAHAVVPDVLFTYYNGPVLLTPKIYLIFWGYKTYGDTDDVAKLLKAYVKVMGGSGHNNIYTQYYDIVNSKTNYVTNPKKQLGGVWFDQTNAVPANPTDAQVAQESLQGVAHFGYDVNASYVVATPHGHSTQGFGTQWCAYHSNTFSGNNLVSYTNLPYMPDAGANCGANFTAAPKDESATDEGVTIVEGHEEGESVTDPNPGTGWYNFQYGEIGDICAWTDIQNDTFGKKSYTMQPMFSNASQSCVHTYQ
jgi:serine protease